MRKYALGFVAMMLIAVAGYAADITANFTLLVQKGNLNIQRVANQNLTMTNVNPNVSGFTQNIPTNTAGTALTLGNIQTNGVSWVHNLSTNNYIEVGAQVTGVFYPVIRLNAGEAWCYRAAWGLVPYARANGAQVVLENLIFDN